MEPVILHMDVTIEVPLLTLHYSKKYIIFKANAIDVMSNDSRNYTAYRTLTLTNHKGACVTATVEISTPFAIFRIKSLNWNMKNQASDYNITVESGQSVEVIC